MFSEFLKGELRCKRAIRGQGDNGLPSSYSGDKKEKQTFKYVLLLNII